ncbi:hypothetical protein SETIT_2G211400v2 [Setaria italica]|uniref:WAT1-related protein n=1 Tax=Setaria italica TaxID=4555 RepID=A0A368Q145_SETIT|nr:hypothetical protein SETIT_2G211400v2 [Setaria italica]
MTGLGIVGFSSLVFIAATVNQCLYYQGVHLGSSSMATAMTNLIPAITFVMAASVGLEKVEARRPRSLAKIFGTCVCVGGAMAMAFFKGPKLLGDLQVLLHLPAGSNRCVVGALFLVGSSSCSSLWLILQVPICKSYVDPLALSAWMCLLSTLQYALLPPAGPGRLADPLALRALLLPLLGRVRVGRDVLPAVVVHLGEGPALLGHVQPALHRHHHRVRGGRAPGRAARRQVCCASALGRLSTSKRVINLQEFCDPFLIFVY